MPKRRCCYKLCKASVDRDRGIVRGMKFWCGVDHQIAWAIEAGKKLKEKEWKEKKLEDKRGRYSHQFTLTKKAAQALANALDAGLPCICCNEPRGKAQFCGGHYKTAGAHPELRNIHGQRNALCNQHKSGNITGDKHSKGYKQGLVDRYGQALVDWLDVHHEAKNYTCDDLIAMRKEYAAEIRRLKDGLTMSKNWREL
jgi:hypothetical protein